jgi:hypothetical protein
MSEDVEQHPLRTPEEWSRLLGWRVLDPDGWRGRDGRPWGDSIDQAEFERRAFVSTCSFTAVTTTNGS